MPPFNLAEFKRISAYMRRTLAEVDQLLQPAATSLDDVTLDVLDAAVIVEDVLDAEVIG